MSSQAQSGPSVPKDQEKKGLGKFLSRAKTVFKSSSSKRASVQQPPTSSTTAATTQAKSSTPAPAAAGAGTSAAATAPKTSQKPAEPKKNKYDDVEGVTRVLKQDLFEERARKLGEKYGLEIKKSDWYSTEGTALRVEKPIRMRVHRTCAACSATFSSAKECPSCGSTKYKRYPPKRTEAEKIASRERRAALIKANKENAPIIPDYNYDPRKEPVLTKPSKCGGQDLVHKKPRQRVRRTCHECQSLFTTGNKTCDKCSHVRCTDCPRDPPKKDKYPFGYPGDEFGPNSIPHHECHECKTFFPGGVPDGTACTKCSHEKCPDCPRLKPRKVEPEPDPAVLQSLQAKIEALKLG
ncbi:hypothetical protein B0T11DRAFT_270990 [Plectosphaerella cucumerina]|uniref:Uncharacterized protein n=1 Tax=Plectosphaerella cucumerina TaxID=40658 RepID=A0A8K0TPR4_9PEZI|nr:hypothetical protein B0T11DRAFT_270990 [Plectosphaerella cucumerina]